MLRKGETEVQAACALVSALDDREITLSEFEEAVAALTSETAQVMATALRACGGLDYTSFELLRSAYFVCSRIATHHRVLC